MSHSKTIFSYLLPLVILILSGMQKGKAQDTLKVEIIPSTSIIDVCNSEKRIEIYVQTNEIYAKDSLIGYDFYLEFDKDKIIIEQPIKPNTLTSKIEAAGGFSYFGLFEPGVYHAVAFIQNGSSFVKGSEPLIAFKGRYKDSCEGFTSIRISDFEAEYQNITTVRNVKFDEEKYIKGEVADLNGREFKTLFIQKELEIGKNDSIDDIDLLLQFQQNAQLKNANIVFRASDSKLLNIVSIVTLQNSIIIDTIIENEDSTQVKISFSQNFQTSLPALRLKLKSLKDSNFTSPISARIVQTNVCTCIKKLSGDIANIRKIKSDSIMSVEVDQDIVKFDLQIIESDNNIKLFSSEIINEVGIFNILGIELVRFKIEYPSFNVSLPQNLIQNGAYIVEIITNAENKRKYIKFIK
ncbi:MAG: hypothetical protein HYZ54_09660 [Ignavibacteriae bacterium]|nr:hypothetical protein [Ignavibacteriota bacterium]